MVAMSLIKKYRKCQDILSYLGTSHESIHYTGWIGYGNLGDELLLQATQAMFEPRRIVCPPETSLPVIRNVMDKKHHQLAILGGGTQIGHQSPIKRFSEVLARSENGIVLGAGVSPSLSGPIPEWLSAWGEVLRPLTYVGVRGLESAATLRRVDVQAEVLGDPVCYFAKPGDFWQPQGTKIGVNVGHSNGHVYGSEERFQQVMVDTVSHLIKEGFEIEFFCVWLDDLGVTQSVAARCGIERPIIHETYYRAEDFQERVKFMNAFIGIKLHAVALATCSNVPSIMIEYRPKCLEYMKSIDAGQYCLRSDQAEPKSLLEMFDEVWNERSSVSKRLCTSTSVLRENIVLTVERLKEQCF
jgi:polysaccharide pyruvyl transferase WcaK-like protein